MAAIATSRDLKSNTRPSESNIVYTCLRDAQQANALSDVTGDVSIADVVTSIHLFLACEWLNDHRRSWDHLQQALTRAQSLKVDMDWNEPSRERSAFWVTRLKLYYAL